MTPRSPFQPPPFCEPVVGIWCHWEQGCNHHLQVLCAHRGLHVPSGWIVWLCWGEGHSLCSTSHTEAFISPFPPLVGDVWDCFSLPVHRSLQSPGHHLPGSERGASLALATLAPEGLLLESLGSWCRVKLSAALIKILFSKDQKGIKPISGWNGRAGVNWIWTLSDLVHWYF